MAGGIGWVIRPRAVADPARMGSTPSDRPEEFTVRYISTRGGMQPQPFSETLLEGLAPDGGLAVPEVLPQVESGTLERWRALTYPQLAAEVLGLFATDIPRPDLARMTEAA